MLFFLSGYFIIVTEMNLEGTDWHTEWGLDSRVIPQHGCRAVRVPQVCGDLKEKEGHEDNKIP